MTENLTLEAEGKPERVGPLEICSEGTERASDVTWAGWPQQVLSPLCTFLSAPAGL